MKDSQRKIGRPSSDGILSRKADPSNWAGVGFGSADRSKISGNGTNGHSSPDQARSPQPEAISPNHGGNGRREWLRSFHNGSAVEAACSPEYPTGLSAGEGLIRIPRWKRILDIACIVLGLPFWLPITIAVMAFVRLASPGPIFYRQERVGYRQRRFMLFKFRTMHVNADTGTHKEYFAQLIREDCPMAKLDASGDSRLITGARFLRASGLDELPQIFNVLRGEMSLVGPRPCLPNEFEHYQAGNRSE